MEVLFLLKLGAHPNLLSRLWIKWGPSWNESCDSSILAILSRLGSFEILITFFFTLVQVIGYNIEQSGPTTKSWSLLMKKDNLWIWFFSQSKIISNNTIPAITSFLTCKGFPEWRWISTLECPNLPVYESYQFKGA